MSDEKEKNESVADQKKKIRERYKGVDESMLEIIPAIPQEDFFTSVVHKRVAVYARVSTDDPRQTSSYELQRNHYTDFVNQHPNWELVDIYADEGISGTSLMHRDAFIRMIADCKAGKIDLIVTKSVSRFARNIIDCIGYVRELKAMQPPVEVFFETENIHTLNANSEMSLSFIATLAQEESHTKSEIMNASIQMRFNRGIFLTPVLLGYDKDEDGNLVINEDEAEIVRLIFYMYLFGYSPKEIADTLTECGSATKKGNTTWSTSSIMQILQNERHCGDVLAHKTWTPNYLDHKSKKNNGERAKVYQRDHHEPIISHDVFMAVQKMIRGSKYGGRGILPELQVISDGILNGYVVVNIHWAAFKAADYHMAYAKVLGEPVVIPGDTIQIEKQEGDFDLRGFEIARSQFFSTKGQLIITFTPKSIIFSTSLVRRFTDKMEIEILVHPEKKLIAIRPSQPASRNRIKWAKHHEGGLVGRIVTGTAFLPALYELFGWQNRWKYQIIGTYLQNGSDSIIVFDTSEAVVLVPPDVVTSQKKDITPLSRRGKTIPAYPDTWSESFGDDVYAQESSDAVDISSDDWNAGAEGISYMDPEKSVLDDEGNDINGTMNDPEDILHYEIHVQNPANATKLFKVSDKMINQTVIESSISNNGTVTGDTIKWEVNIPAKSSVTLKFDAKANGYDLKVPNTATVAVDKVTIDTNETVIWTPPVPVKAVETINGIDINGKSIKFNDEFFYKIKVRNNSELTKSFVVKDSIPEEVKFIEAGHYNGNYVKGGSGAMSLDDRNVTWTFDLTPNEERILYIKGRLEAVDVTFANRATQIVERSVSESNEVSNWSGRIIINAEIEEYYEPYGQPSFIYSITDKNGTGDTWYRMITIDTETRKGQAVYDIPTGYGPDTWVAKDEKNARYTFVSAAPETANFTTEGNTGTGLITQTSRVGIVDYLYRITKWDETSHMDAVTNTINYRRS